MSAQARLSISLLVVASLVLGLGAPAIAADTVLTTPVITVPVGDAVRCRLLNIGTKPIKVDFHIHYGLSGSAIRSYEDVLVYPGAWKVQEISATADELDGYCKFIGVFPRTSVRASIEHYNAYYGSVLVVGPAE